ncbi:unknown protein [Seminavis robusta]|uniref:Uncharacterized protein n=1 Tax=Seminavis robusta TaxID=568900 RepID=A0A9N8F3C8_9STRA|nr:unknown protein [Seminavis robusta]|eukprot:Sro2926_g340400.1 n/a (317) ;mRNA; f:2866-4189
MMKTLLLLTWMTATAKAQPQTGIPVHDIGFRRAPADKNGADNISAATTWNNTDVARHIWPYTPYREAKLRGKLEHLIKDQLEEANSEFASNLFSILIPQVVRAGGIGFCAALNPCTHTYAIGQTGIIPDVGIAGIIFVTLDAVVFSLTKQLGKETLNRMWDGTGEPEEIFVDGHIAVRGTGSMGIKFSPKVSATVNVDLSLIIDVAPNSRNNEIAPNSQALKDNNDNSENVDFEILLSGEPGVVFEVVSSLGGRTETHTVDLSGVITVEADMYLYVSGEDTKLMLAASINVMLGGICGMTPLMLQSFVRYLVVTPN